jgi:hypothetical protein
LLSYGVMSLVQDPKFVTGTDGYKCALPKPEVTSAWTVVFSICKQQNMML